jgi:hypothetical protein
MNQYNFALVTHFSYPEFSYRYFCLSEHFSSPIVCSGVHVARSLFFCVVFCGSVCSIVLFLLTIVLPVPLRATTNYGWTEVFRKGELKCSERVSNSYSNSGTLRATLVTNPVMIHEDENDIIAITASEIYPWWFVARIYHYINNLGRQSEIVVCKPSMVTMLGETWLIARNNGKRTMDAIHACTSDVIGCQLWGVAMLDREKKV